MPVKGKHLTNNDNWYGLLGENSETLLVPLIPNALAMSTTTNYFFLRSFLLTSDTKLPFESRLKLRFFALVCTL